VTVAQTEFVETRHSISPAGDTRVEFNRRLRRYRLGLGLVACGIVMLFASFFSAYIVRKGVANYDYAAQSYSAEWQPLKLPAGLLGVATGLLLLASVAMEIARRKALRVAAQANSIWVYVSALLTTGFLVTVAIAWHVLSNQGHGMSSAAEAAFFYLLTAVHSVHVVIGLLFLGYVAIRRNAILIDLSAWYWHAMSALWLCIMGLFLI
jgi:cytochrome c oxidase subunit 3